MNWKIILLCAVFMFLLVGCVQNEDSVVITQYEDNKPSEQVKNEEVEYSLPDDISEEANKFMVSQYGSEYFNDYIFFVEFMMEENLYRIKYALNHPEVPELSAPYNIVSIWVDSNGEVIRTDEIFKCIDMPDICPPFAISKQEAIEIIKEIIPSQDTYDLDVSFIQIAGYEGYTWHLSFGSGEKTSMRSNHIFLNPSTGEIVRSTGIVYER